jgi:hypothetical protein
VSFHHCAFWQEGAIPLSLSRLDTLKELVHGTNAADAFDNAIGSDEQCC